jgi:CRP/FNR family transcriptional regulator, dissimilatory nitrate respiration regulator
MDYSLLSASPLFRGLSSEEIVNILSGVTHRIRSFKPGSMISQSGEKVTSMNFVVKGIVKGEMVDYSGKIIKIEDIPAPGALAPAFIFGYRNKYPVNVVAVTDAEILIIEKEDFLKILMSNDKVLVNFLDIISNRSQFLSEKIKFLNFKTIKSKLAQYILQLSNGKKGHIRFDRSQNDIADFFGVARPSIARALGELGAEGIISSQGKDVTVLDVKRLTELTSD